MSGCCGAPGLTTASADVAIACSLDAAALAGRLSEWSATLELALDRRRVAGGWTLGFPAEPELAGRLADLVVREQQCCAFFSFAIIVNGDGRVVLEARAPEAAASLLDALLDAT